VQAKKTLGEDAAIEIGTDFAFDEASNGRSLLARVGEECLEALSDDFVKKRLLRLVALVVGQVDPVRDRVGVEIKCRRIASVGGGAHFPDCSACVSLGSDIHFDIAEDWTIGHAGPGFDIFTVAAHEIGHAIGLDHSEQNDALMFGVYSEAFVGLQADDILGAQSIYGVAPPTFAIVVLPEPDTVVLLTTGLIGLGACRRNLRVRT
jgi:hypothetical protein